MTGKGSRDKGARGELELVHLLTDLGFQGLRRGNVFAGDADVVGLFPFHIEVKRVEKLNLWNAVQQAIAEMHKKKDGEIPVVFHRKNNQKWLMTIPEEWFGVVISAVVWYWMKENE